MIELNAIEPDTAVKLDELEVISPKMTTKEIREVVKAYKKGEIDENGNFVGSDEPEAEETEEAEPEEVDETAMLIVDTMHNISRILEDERIIKDTMTVSKLQEMKKFLDSINL